MHEAPITKTIIDIADEFSKKNGCKKIKSITLTVGQLCSFIPSTIELYFTEFSKETSCENAFLKIEIIKTLLKCSNCDMLFERKLYSFLCPECGCEGSFTDIGKEFYIKEIELEGD